MATSKSKTHATPAGGVRSSIFFLNDQLELVDETVATACEIVEYNKDGEAIMRTYGTLTPKSKDETP